MALWACATFTCCTCVDAVTERPTAAPLAAEIVVLSESETAGPLFDVRGLLVTQQAKWILDAGNDRVLLLRNGRPAVAIGREGSGPGEFRGPRVLTPHPQGGTVVWDQSLLRITRIADTGEIVGTKPVDVLVPGLDVVSVFRLQEGYAAILNKSLSAMNPPPKGEHLSGLLLRLNEDMEIEDTLARLPVWGPITLWEQRAGVSSLNAFTPPFDAPPHMDLTTACRGLLAISTGGRAFRVEFFDLKGQHLASLEDAHTGDPITEAEREAYFGQFDPEMSKRFNLRGIIKMPERHAAVQDLQLTSNGLLSVRLTPRRGITASARWRFWPISVSAGHVELGMPFETLFPDRFSLYDVRSDTIWGVSRDSLDVPTVRGYAVAGGLGRTC